MKVRLLLVSLSSAILLTAQSPITPESLRSLPNVGDPAISPDGKYLLYTVGKTNFEANTRENKLMLLNLSNNAKTELTQDVSDPQWTPDGKAISFRTSASGTSGIYKGDLLFEEGKPVLDIPLLVSRIHTSEHFLGHPTRKNYQWSPDGSHVAYGAADPQTCIEGNDPNEPLVVERTLYKTRTGFTDHCLTKLYQAEKDGRYSRELTQDKFDSHSLSWSPDGRSIVFVSNHTEEPDHNYNNDLFIFHTETGEVTRLTDTPGTEHDPQWSPKGDWIAFPATRRSLNTKDSPAENTDIYVISPDGKTRINLTEKLDRRASDPRWHPDGEWLFFKVRNEGKVGIYRVKPGSEEAPKPIVMEKGMVGDLVVGKEQLFYEFSSPGRPTEIFAVKTDGIYHHRVTYETASWRSGKAFAQLEEYWFDSFDGARVQGFVAFSAELPKDKKIPVIHRIHGGPHGMYGYSFSDLNELLVAEGYAVVYINPRGSTGYGQQFADGTLKAWGGGDYQDLMAGIEAALKNFPFLDGTNMGVIGGSYGGFMTNWVVTQTDRYKAAVTIASVSNLISFYGTSLYQLLIETEFGGLPWEDYELLWKFSPLAHVKNVKTPTLLLHGENDNDVPIAQAEEFYMALRKLGVPTRFVRYPNEGHGIRQPKNHEHFFGEIMAWFERFLR